jgi:hypothetical protein
MAAQASKCNENSFVVLGGVPIALPPWETSKFKQCQVHPLPSSRSQVRPAPFDTLSEVTNLSPYWSLTKVRFVII